MENLPITIQTLIAELIKFIPNVIAALVIFFLGFILAGFAVRVVGKALTRRETEGELIHLFSRITKWTVVGFFTITALEQVNFDLTAFLAGLGIVGFTVGFALQDVSKNFIAGLLLLLEQPFDIGEAIEVNGISGTVLTVDLRATEIRTFDGRIVLIPNADVFTSAITNFTRAVQRRINLAVGVAYGSDLEVVRETTLGAIQSIQGVLSDPAPQVVFGNFGESSIDYDLYFWIDTGQIGYFNATDAAVTGINEAFKRKGIEIPYPTRTIISPKA